MAPSTLLDDLPKDGRALDDISDKIDAVNIIKAQYAHFKIPKDSDPSALGTASQFDADKDKTQFRQFADACAGVKAFYAEQHAKQTVAYNLAARAHFKSAARERPELSVWEAMEKLDTLVDASDPDTSLSQIEHLLQTAEALRHDGRPRWMQAAGLVHDLGKLLFFFGAQGQWDVVGDTFPVGCRFDERIIYHEAFAANPDARHPVYGTEHGIYEQGCGLDNLMLSWGHDEYLYHVVRDQSKLPDEALAMIRYHSFYVWHKDGGYRHFMAEKDWRVLEAVKAFNPYDLYSKSEGVPSVDDLKVSSTPNFIP